MSKPKELTYNLKERLQKIQNLNLREPLEAYNADPLEACKPLKERINDILQIIKAKPAKATTMNYLIMYDIENNKVRSKISKYLERKGCVRIQKSIFMASSHSKDFQEIYQTLLEVQSYYENEDSILLVPHNTSDLRSMKIIGKEVHIDTFLEKPNTLFF